MTELGLLILKNTWGPSKCSQGEGGGASFPGANESFPHISGCALVECPETGVVEFTQLFPPSAGWGRQSLEIPPVLGTHLTKSLVQKMRISSWGWTRAPVPSSSCHVWAPRQRQPRIWDEKVSGFYTSCAAAARLQGTTSHSHNFLSLYLLCTHVLFPPRSAAQLLQPLLWNLSLLAPDTAEPCQLCLAVPDRAHVLPRWVCRLRGHWDRREPGRIGDCSPEWGYSLARCSLGAGGWAVTLTRDPGAASQGRVQSSPCSSPLFYFILFYKIYIYFARSFSLEGRRFISILLREWKMWRDFGSLCSG